MENPRGIAILDFGGQYTQLIAPLQNRAQPDEEAYAERTIARIRQQAGFENGAKTGELRRVGAIDLAAARYG